jgi:cell division cycle protein 37
MEKANQRIKVLEHDLRKLEQQKKDDSDSEDEDLDDSEALKAELKELLAQNAARQAKLDEYEKNKKWNIDNMFHETQDKTIVNPAPLPTYQAGYVVPKEMQTQKSEKKVSAAVASSTGSTESKKPAAIAPPASSNVVGPQPTKKEYVEIGVFESYPEFTEKYEEILEDFLKCPDFAQSQAFLLQNADVLLQENAYNYLLLASLEYEMNGQREKMKQSARQTQLISNIVELAKSLDTHPGNVIQPFFARMQERESLEQFLENVKSFQEKLIQRAIVKRKELDAERQREAPDLHDVPREERLGPGGLDPLEVIETLPEEMVRAFESRNVEQLKEALMKLEPEQAEYHMKRCIDSGLWVANANEAEE